MTRPHPVLGVLFDAAGTLITLREPVGETYARFVARYGVRLPAARLDEAFQRVFASAPAMVFPGEPPERVRVLERDWWRGLLRATLRATDGTARFKGADRSDRANRDGGDRDGHDGFDACFDELWTHYSGAAAWQSAPGLRPMAAELARLGLRTGILSNFDHRLAQVLQDLGIHDLFEIVAQPWSCGAAKPDPGIFAAALDRLGLPREAVVYVGDDPIQDVSAARSAGLQAIDAGSLAKLTDLPAQLVHATEQE